MLRYVLRRCALAVPTGLGIVLVAFAILHLTPGDPARLIAGENADQQTVELIRQQLGLDRPLHEQLGTYIANVARLDLGRSLQSKVPVKDELAARLPYTLKLATLALLLSIVLGGLIGVFSALNYGRFADFSGLLTATLLVSIPSFWLGLLLIQFFAVVLGWLPAAGAGAPGSIVLPALALSAYSLALLARLIRSGCLEVLAQDYVRTAQAKGVGQRLVVLRHVLKNALLPVVTVIGIQFGDKFGGSVVVESVFAWPGVGQMLVQAIFQRDYPVVQGGLLVIGLGAVLINLVVDVSYGFLDPRIRYG